MTRNKCLKAARQRVRGRSVKLIDAMFLPAVGVGIVYHTQNRRRYTVLRQAPTWAELLTVLEAGTLRDDERILL